MFRVVLMLTMLAWVLRPGPVHAHRGAWTMDSTLWLLEGIRTARSVGKVAGGRAARDSVAVSIRFVHELSGKEIAELERIGVRFYRMYGEILHVERIYGARVDWGGLKRLREWPAVERIESSWQPKVVSPLNVANAEVGGRAAWTLGGTPGSLTGEGVRIADFDTGIDVFHPSFWRADGDTIHWLDRNGNGRFDSGTDGVDLDGDGVFDVGETLRFWDAEVTDTHDQLWNIPGVFEADLDWLYVDRNGNGRRDFGPTGGFREDDPTFGEPLFVVEDENGNNALDVGERLIALKTCKIVATLEANGIERRRGSGLIYSRGDDVNHGTLVCGIAVGEPQLERRMTGIAPGAELLAVNREGVPSEVYIPWARRLGADVMMYEFGTWIFQFMDGSSNLEQMIDAMAREGIVQLTASGNLAGPRRKKHCRTVVPAGGSRTIRINVPEGVGIRTIYFSIIWISADSSLGFDLISPRGETWALQGDGEVDEAEDRSLFSRWEVSPRGTSKLDGTVYREEGAGGVWKLRVRDLVGKDQRVDGYVTDDVTRWVNGAQFLDFVTDDGTVTWPGTADEAITVGAYDPRGARNPKGTINDFSGWGKRVDGLPIVEITAPGSVVYSPWSHTYRGTVLGGYGEAEGTSAALPFVAGAAALLLEADPSLGHDGVRRALTQGALSDAFTGAVPNDMWGYGKLRIVEAIHYTGFEGNVPPVFIGTTMLEDTEETTAPYEVETNVYDVDGVQGVSLFFSTDSLRFGEVPMEALGGGAYRAAIPPAGWGTRIWYYLEGEDRVGHRSVDPPGAPDRRFSFEVKGLDLIFREISPVGLDRRGPYRGAAWGDYNGDGLPDLFMACAGEPDRLYRNEGSDGRGNGHFTEVAAEVGVADGGVAQDAVWGDYDGDGDVDLYVVRYEDHNLLYRNNKGIFVEVSSEAGVGDGGRGQRAAWVDYDRDGALDLYVVDDGRNVLYQNQGDGTFEDVTLRARVGDRGQGRAAVWADYNGDGWPDLYVVNDGGANRLYRNRGDGRFEEVGATLEVDDDGPGQDAVWADLDNDGDVDLYVVNYLTDNLLYENIGDGTFREVGGPVGVGLAGPDRAVVVGDVDNNGDLDLYVVSEGQENALYLGQDGRLLNAGVRTGAVDPGFGRRAVLDDYNGDGGLDLVVLDEDGSLRLYRNAQQRNHWIGIRLWGKGGHRSATGANVRVTVGEKVQTRWVWDQDLRPLLFGLGEHERADAMEITWVDGTVRSLDLIPGDGLFLVPQEGEVDVFVWPGDVDNDGDVDVDDVVSLAEVWGLEGPKRPGATGNWMGQGATFWRPAKATLGDANGDGTVDGRDLEVVARNWGRRHPVRAEAVLVYADSLQVYLTMYEKVRELADSDAKLAMRTFLEGKLHGIGVSEEVLLWNTPNPFGGETVIRFAIPVGVDRARMELYNLLGQRIRVLVDGAVRPGRGLVRWDGRDAEGHPVGSGVYVCLLRVGRRQAVRKIAVLR